MFVAGFRIFVFFLVCCCAGVALCGGGVCLLFSHPPTWTERHRSAKCRSVMRIRIRMRWVQGRTEPFGARHRPLAKSNGGVFGTLRSGTPLRHFGPRSSALGSCNLHFFLALQMRMSLSSGRVPTRINQHVAAYLRHPVRPGSMHISTQYFALFFVFVLVFVFLVFFAHYANGDSIKAFY